MKRVAAETLRLSAGFVDRGHPFDFQARAQLQLSEQLHLTKVGLQEHTRRKSLWDLLLRNGLDDHFQYTAIELPISFPMMGAGTFFPEYDFSGTYLQPPGKYLHQYDLLAFSVARLGNTIFLVFGWLSSEPAGGKFVSSLSSLKSTQIREAAHRFCLDITDNLYLRPSWWDAKSEQEKAELVEFGLSSLPGKRDFDALVPNGNPVFS